MMKTISNRFFSILLVLCMVLTLIPAMTVPAFADGDGVSVEVKNSKELREALANPEVREVNLTADIYLYYHFDVVKQRYEISSNGEFANGTKFARNPEFFLVKGEKVLDLMGHEIELYGPSFKSSALYETSKNFFVFNIERNAILQIGDSSEEGTGKVYHHGSLIEMETNPLHFGGANIFNVERKGKLIINGGTYQAGRSSKSWCVFVNDDDEGGYYNGWAYNMGGGAVVMNNAGEVYINDGDFIGHGAYHNANNSYGVIVNRTEAGAAAKIVINGGTFKGVNKKVYHQVGNNNSLDIKAGTFTTQKLKLRYGLSSTWSVKDVQTALLGINGTDLDPRAGFKYDGKVRDYNWVKEVNLALSSKKLEVLPGAPIVTLDPLPDDYIGHDEYEYVFARGAEKSITTVVDWYFKENGIEGPAAFAEYELYDVAENDFPKFELEKVSNNHDAAVFKPDTSKRGSNSYIFKVSETSLAGAKTSTSVNFDVSVINAPAPVISISADANPVNPKDPVTLIGKIEKGTGSPFANFKWEIYEDGSGYEDITPIPGTDGDTGNTNEITFTAPEPPGVYLIRGSWKDDLGAEGSDILLLRVGGDDTAPRIATEELIFKHGVQKMAYLENSGGIVDNNAWTCTGTLPQGLTFSTSNGLGRFGGTPTEVGKFPVTVTATNSAGSSTKTVDIVVTAPIEITSNSSLLDGVKGEDYEANLKYTGGGNVGWTLSDSKLPKGLTLEYNTGKITGKPEESGEFEFIVKAEATGEIPAVKTFNLFIHEKPKYPEAGFAKSITAGKTMTIKSPLLEGTGDITYMIGGAPSGVSIEPNGDIKVWEGLAAKETPYTFTISARGYDGYTDTCQVEFTVAESPTYLGKGIIYLPMGWVGEEYLTDQLASEFIGTTNACEWQFINSDVVPEPLEPGVNPLPPGLSLDKDTGVISGKPTGHTGSGNGGINDYQEGVRVRLYDKETGLSAYAFVRITVVDKAIAEAPTTISFSSDSNVHSTTMSSFVEGFRNIYIDWLPPGTISATGLPKGLSISRAGNDAMLQGTPMQNGTFNFTVTATNSEGSKSQNMTVVISPPEKAEKPTADKVPGEYKIGQTVNVKLSNTAGEGAGIRYSINDGPEKTWNVENQESGLDLTGDTVIRAYVETLGMGKLNSDIATFRYTFVNDTTAPVVDITTNSLPDGIIDQVYVDLNLEGTVSGSALPPTWTANGLPSGISVSPEGAISGTPTESGDFNVKLIATDSGTKTSREKYLTLHIGDKAPADTPVIITHPANGTYKEGSEASYLTVAATVSDGGALSYLWYESADKKNDTPANDKLVGNGPKYRPSTALATDRYYYAVAINSKTGFADSKKVSNVATISVIFDAATPYFSDNDTRDYLVTKGKEQNLMELALVDDDGVLNYEWYQMVGASPATGDTKIGENKTGILSITAPENEGDKISYYAVVTNTNKKATGSDTAGPVISPLHTVTATDQVMREITFNPQTGNAADIFTRLTNFDGKLESLPVFERIGYNLSGWFTEPTGGVKITTDTVFEENDTVYAQWTAQSSGGGSGGGGISGGGSPGGGTPVEPEKPETPDPGDGEKTDDLPFTDVKKGDWFYDDVYYAYVNKLMMGTSATTFSPHANTTRGMIVAILHRLEGSPEASLEGLFRDVNKDQYYAEAIAWAAANNIVSGYSSDKFGPEDPITREQMALILMNYAKFKGYDVKAKADLSKFSDAGTVSAWATDAMSWTNAEAFIQGSGNSLLPAGNAERCQIAAILHRFIEGHK
ncbi:MAG: putative Ig domain-containing protein [Anaerovoracaceae bacterium]